MWIKDVWFVRFGEYIGYWPGMLVLAVAYVIGVVMAVMHYRSLAKKVLYVLALTVSMSVLWNVLELVVLY